MIIWRGWGFLVAVFAFGASLAMELITESMTGDDTFYQREAWPLALAFVVAGVVTWFVGQWLHARELRAASDTVPARAPASSAAHSLFFVPMHYWGVLLIALAALPFVLRR
jgi:hypothetical protein